MAPTCLEVVGHVVNRTWSPRIGDRVGSSTPVVEHVHVALWPNRVWNPRSGDRVGSPTGSVGQIPLNHVRSPRTGVGTRSPTGSVVHPWSPRFGGRVDPPPTSWLSCFSTGVESILFTVKSKQNKQYIITI